MSRRAIVIFCSGLALLTGVAQVHAGGSGYPSAMGCDRYAHDYAQRASMQGELFGGAAIGSLAGLGIGSLFAASGVGAAVGAVVGLIGGAAVQQRREEQIYYAAYYDCMTSRQSGRTVAHHWNNRRTNHVIGWRTPSEAASSRGQRAVPIYANVRARGIQ
jgi:hypothetical protein